MQLLKWSLRTYKQHHQRRHNIFSEILQDKTKFKEIKTVCCWCSWPLIISILYDRSNDTQIRRYVLEFCQIDHISTCTCVFECWNIVHWTKFQYQLSTGLKKGTIFRAKPLDAPTSNRLQDCACHVFGCSYAPGLVAHWDILKQFSCFTSNHLQSSVWKCNISLNGLKALYGGVNAMLYLELHVNCKYGRQSWIWRPCLISCFRKTAKYMYLRYPHP